MSSAGRRRTAASVPRCARRDSRATARRARASEWTDRPRPPPRPGWRRARRRRPRSRQRARPAGRLARNATAAPMSSVPRVKRLRLRPAATTPGRSIASALMFASASRCATTCQSSRGRPSIGTSTTAGAGDASASSNRPVERAAVGSAKRDDAAGGVRPEAASRQIANAQLPTPRPRPSSQRPRRLGVRRWALGVACKRHEHARGTRGRSEQGRRTARG